MNGMTTSTQNVGRLWGGLHPCFEFNACRHLLLGESSFRRSPE